MDTRTSENTILRDSTETFDGLDAAIRTDFRASHELAEIGHWLATSKSIQLPVFREFRFPARLNENEAAILANYDAIAAASRNKQLITPAAEWLLDNHHLVRENIRQVRRDLPVKFFRQLPNIAIDGGVALPRMFALAWTYIAHTDSHFEGQTLTATVSGFQQTETLLIGEIWAIPAILRFILIENLRRISDRVDRSRQMRVEANKFADFLATSGDRQDLDAVFREKNPLTSDDAFAAQLLYRLREDSEAASRALAWLEQRLEERDSNAEEVMISEHTKISTSNLTVGNIIRSLRRIDDFDWTKWFEHVSKVDSALRDGSDYALLDAATRNYYRNSIEKIARRSEKTEIEVAIQALDLASRAGGTEAEARQANVGYYLIDSGVADLKAAVGYRRKITEGLASAYRSLGIASLGLPVLIIMAAIIAFAAWIVGSVPLHPLGTAVLLVAFLPLAFEASLALVRALVYAVMEPSHLAGYEFKDGIPDSARTLVAMPCLLSDRDTVSALVRNLEIHYLANPDDGIYFALLSDWPDSEEEDADTDREVLQFAEREIERLALKYRAAGPRRFFLLHRKRLFNSTENTWMGWERKRGKLHELNLLLRGDLDTTFLPPAVELPHDIQYVLTLDADTRLQRDSARKLIGKLAHPLNAPVFDPAVGRVVEGHGLLQPRVTPSLTTGDEASVFQRIFSKDRGLDPYVFAVSDLYQDMFGEGSFTGKGIYQVDAFEAALHGRIDENTVLSHDLLEGSFARCGLVTDVAFIEDFPVRYEVELSRQHRWVRGDWQLLSYIFDPTNNLSVLSRFKMLDNLRRSLMPLFWVAGSVFGWLLLPASAAALWQLTLIVSYFSSAIVSLFAGVAPRQVGVAPQRHLWTLLEEAVDIMAQIGVHLAFMAHNAVVMTDAVIRTLYRLFVSRRHLLEWRTAQEAHSDKPNAVTDYYRMMAISLAATIAVYGLVVALAPQNEVIAGILSLAWFAAPALAWWISQSLENEDCLTISAKDATALRVIARRTWHYFETFVTEEHHYLPPDNFQEVPIPYVAHRTSPTNIGLYFLSTITARDMGWISFAEAIDRVERTIGTVEKMEKCRGHLYNWYDTRTLATLWPRYVSSVDSGNLAAHLIVVSSTFKEWSTAPAAFLLGDVRGIGDTLEIVRGTLATIPDNRRNLRPLRRRLEERLDGFAASLEANLKNPDVAPVRSISLSVIASEIEAFTKDLDGEVQSAASQLLADWADRLKRACEGHFSDAVYDRSQTQALRERLMALSERARALAFGMDFGFLFNRERRLLSIGFQADEHRLDESCYDLLASEARLTSLFAIAKGDIPSEHWFRLGRPVTSVRGQASLVSWSGSMFEYLMPPVVMHERQGGILNQSNNLSIEGQIRYARSIGIPWGVSESAYNARDRELNYQYTNFGVPQLGLKRDIGANVVIAPYATALASQFRPREAAANYRQLDGVGALGVYGYYDAVDFTESRLPEGKKCVVVQNYMAHHQGMTITSIGNAVLNGRLRDRFHSDPVIEAAELLLQEKAPRDFVPIVKVEGAELRSDSTRLTFGPKYRVVDDPLQAKRAVSVLSNGHYSMMVTAAGSGYSKWNGLAVTRWQPDPTVDDWGSYVFLRDIKSGDWWSATPGPKSAPDEITQTVFADEKAEFKKSVGSIESKLECIVATEADAEGRRIVLRNIGESDRYIEVTSYGEFVLSNSDSDAAHPVFSKMFVRTEIGETRDVIYAIRNKRSHGEPDMQVAHLMTGTSGRTAQFQAETDRRAFIGRGRDLPHAQAFDSVTESLAGHEGFTLDPIFSLRRVVRVPAGREASVVFWTIAAPNRAELDKAVERYRHHESFEHEARLAWTRSQVQMRHLDMSHEEALLFQRIASFLIYPDTRLKQGLEGADAPQSSLWPMSISGDFPIFAIRIDNDVDLPIINKAFRMQEYLRSRGVISDLVIINERGATYAQDVQHAIDFMCENAARRGLSSGPAQHIFSVRRDLIDDAAYEALIGAARIILHTRNGSIAEQIDRLEWLADGEDIEGPSRDALPPHRPKRLPAREKQPAVKAEPIDVAGDGLVFWNGYGGFDTASRDYVIRLPGGGTTPHPWINVISNGMFGFHIAAEGAGFTWSSNSRDYQLTPWSNDTVINRPGEAFYLYDIVTKKRFSPFAALSTPERLHEVRYGPGYAVFTLKADGLEIELTQIVAEKDPAKLSRLRITNRGASTRRLRLYAYLEWVLGNNRAKTAPYIRSWFDANANAMLASNPYSVDNSERTAFLAVSVKPSSYTAARDEFLGAVGDSFNPEAVNAGANLSKSQECAGDPCAALASDIAVDAGETSEILVLLGDVEHSELAEPLIRRLMSDGFDYEMQKTRTQWEEFLGMLQVETPDESFNRLVNTWLPYQGLACRIRARSAFYQASGAFGFRDQLQDTLALMLQDPSLARAQILNAARRQFPEGDVQHWWLPKTGAGVRTLISDDVAWLGYGTAHYVTVTGDKTILDEQIPFLKGEPLGEKHESFFTPEISEDVASLYEHCTRALDLAIARTGDHGLPLILGGDWNDGMNRVGVEGRGESVWLAWFLNFALQRFIPIAKERRDHAHAEAWQAHCDALKKAVETAGWDGEWYRRGYFDDGSPLGSVTSDECRIDSIAQSWSVLSGVGDPQRANQAMDNVSKHLVDAEAQILRLFTPPFEHSDKDPGYIKGYPPGVRENGGQYTHAAIWAAYAFARMGRADDAYKVFSMLNPINHALTKGEAERYRVEPYVVAADIYGAEDRTGRGGWTWYTGSAGWLYRAAIEAILGIRKEGSRLRIEPALPTAWPGFTVRLRQDGRKFEIVVSRNGNGAVETLVNGKLISGGVYEF
jgi:cyclic beta-1,2-glucan synthetase